MRIDEEQTMLDLCKECGVPDSSNIVQCLRVLSLRMASCPGISSWEITNVNDVSILYIQYTLKNPHSLKPRLLQISDICGF